MKTTVSILRVCNPSKSEVTIRRNTLEIIAKKRIFINDKLGAEQYIFDSVFTASDSIEFIFMELFLNFSQIIERQQDSVYLLLGSNTAEVSQVSIGRMQPGIITLFLQNLLMQTNNIAKHMHIEVSVLQESNNQFFDLLAFTQVPLLVFNQPIFSIQPLVSTPIKSQLDLAVVLRVSLLNNNLRDIKNYPIQFRNKSYNSFIVIVTLVNSQTGKRTNFYFVDTQNPEFIKNINLFFHCGIQDNKFEKSKLVELVKGVKGRTSIINHLSLEKTRFYEQIKLLKAFSTPPQKIVFCSKTVLQEADLEQRLIEHQNAIQSQLNTQSLLSIAQIKQVVNIYKKLIQHLQKIKNSYRKIGSAKLDYLLSAQLLFTQYCSSMLDYLKIDSIRNLFQIPSNSFIQSFIRSNVEKRVLIAKKQYKRFRRTYEQKSKDFNSMHQNQMEEQNPLYMRFNRILVLFDQIKKTFQISLLSNLNYVHFFKEFNEQIQMIDKKIILFQNFSNQFQLNASEIKLKNLKTFATNVFMQHSPRTPSQELPVLSFKKKKNQKPMRLNNFQYFSQFLQRKKKNIQDEVSEFHLDSVVSKFNKTDLNRSRYLLELKCRESVQKTGKKMRETLQVLYDPQKVNSKRLMKKIFVIRQINKTRL